MLHAFARIPDAQRRSRLLSSAGEQGKVFMRRSEAEREGFGLLWAVSGLERLRWAALGCDRSAPQLLHEMLPVLKTSMTRFPRDRLRSVLSRELAEADVR